LHKIFISSTATQSYLSQLTNNIWYNVEIVRH